MFSSILVICTGNICRSPYGEYKLRRELPTVRVASAGIAVEKSQLQGSPADKNARIIASEFDIDVSSHRAQQVTQQMVDKYDLILCMEPNQLELLCQSFETARGKSFLFGHWVGVAKIEDPYLQDQQAFRQTFGKINRAALAWVKRIDV